MATPNWIKKLGGHAGELYVCAELSKRGIPNALLPENFTDDDVLIGDKAADHIAFIQVKACHPDRSSSFILSVTQEKWVDEPYSRINQYCVFVWLGRPKLFEPPRYWVARKSDVGKLCVAHSAHGTDNWERRLFPKDLPPEWLNHWSLFDEFLPQPST